MSAQSEKLIAMAEELRRLATNITRDIKRSSQYSSLSGLTAMQPLNQALLDSLLSLLELRSEVHTADQSKSDELDQKTSKHLSELGYL